MPLFARSVLLFSAIILSSCAVQKQPLTPVSELPRAADLLRMVEKRNSDVTSLEGRMSAKIKGAGSKNSSTQLILLKKPSYLRLDALTPFGQPALTMATDGNNISIHYHSRMRFFSGPANGHNISSLIPSSLSIEDLTLILSGGIPLIEYEEGSARLKVSDDGLKLILVGDGVREEITFDTDGLDISETTLYGRGGRIFLSIEMDRYSVTDGMRLPARIRTTLPLEKYAMEINYSEMSINTPLDSELFLLTPPEGVAVERLDSLNL